MRANGREVRGLAHRIVASRVTAFGTSIVASAASVITALVIVVSYAGFASPLVVLITFVASLCCALSIAEFARRVPSAGWAYTYNSRGLGRTAGFLTAWMMIFGYPPGPAARQLRNARQSIHASRKRKENQQQQGRSRQNGYPYPCWPCGALRSSTVPVSWLTAVHAIQRVRPWMALA